MILDIEFTNLMNYIALGIAIVIFLILYIIAKSDFIPTEAQFIGIFILGCFAVICAFFKAYNEDEQFIKTNKTAPFETIQQYIHVEKDKIIIDKLPDEYKFKKIDNIQPSSKETNIFTFIEDTTYNKYYLINYKGEKYMLNEHDAQFIKNKQNALDKTP